MGVVTWPLPATFRHRVYVNVMASLVHREGANDDRARLLVGLPAYSAVGRATAAKLEPSVLNTLLNSIARMASAGLIRYRRPAYAVLPAVFNFFCHVRFASGATMLLLAPLGDLVGAPSGDRSAFQFGAMASAAILLHPTSPADGHAGRVPGRFRNWLKAGVAAGDYVLPRPAVVIGAQMMRDIIDPKMPDDNQRHPAISP